MRFTDIFIRRPVLAASISLLILAMGLAAIARLPVRQYPKIDTTVITITTTFPGASAELMQGFVTQPIQQAVATADGIDYLTSQSFQSQSMVTVQVRLGYDPDAAMTGVMSQVASVRAQLPRGINDPVISKSTGATFSVLYLSFTSDTMSAQQITDYLTRVMQPKLSTVAGVAQPQIMGGSNFAMRVWLDAKRMAAFGLTAGDVQQAITGNNYQSTPGQVRGYFDAFNVDAGTLLTQPEGYDRMIVATRDDGVVRLGDLGDTVLGAQSADFEVVANGKAAVLIGIQTTPEANPLTVVKDVRAILPEIQRNLPDGLNMQVIYDSTQAIQASIDEVVKTVWEAVLIVIVVIFLFLGSPRAVAIPVVTIPLSIVGVCVFLAALGFTINLLTLLAAVLAIGLVVDDAIVVVENVDRHLKEGKTPFQAAIIGTREIAVPVISMTITLAAVYAPIAFMGGLTGGLFREFALTLAGAVVVSGVIALTLSPMMASRMLRPHALDADGHSAGLAGRIDRVFDRVRGVYLRMLRDMLNHRAVVLVFAAIVFASLYPMFKTISHELAPQEDDGAVMVAYNGPSNANLDYMRTFADEISDVFKALPELETEFTVTGYPTLSSGLAIATLKPWEERTRSQAVITHEVQQKLGDVVGLRGSAFGGSSLPGSGDGLPIQFVVNTTSDYRALIEVMERLRAEAEASKLFPYIDVDLKFESPTLAVSINRDKAGAYGVTMSEIGATLATMMAGGYTNLTAIEGRSYQVIPQAPRWDRLTPESIGQYYVKSRTGAPIPLSNLIDVELKVVPPTLNQFNQLNSATLQAALLPGVSVGTGLAMLEEAAGRVLPHGFSYDFKGQSRQFVTEGSALIGTFGLAMVVIFLVLAAQFESFRDPLVVLVSVPLSVCGALIPLSLGLATMNIYSQVGLVTLIGLISKHGILICEVAKENQLKGMSKRQAVEAAAAVRLRPILMTTAAMVAGLIPLLFASGAGAASRFSIGLVIVSGLGIGTLFTLFVLPAIYTVLASTHREPARDVLIDAPEAGMQPVAAGE